MYSKEKLLEMLLSKKASSRYEACEWILTSQESSPEMVNALEKATHDADKDVAERASLALQADVHHQMAIEMGIIEPDQDKVDSEKPVDTGKKVIDSESPLWNIIAIISLVLGLLALPNVFCYSSSQDCSGADGCVLGLYLIYLCGKYLGLLAVLTGIIAITHFRKYHTITRVIVIVALIIGGFASIYFLYIITQ